MEEDRKASARALRTFDGAPKGYWWIVGALVALASAAMLLHESGSWMLDLAPLWGAPGQHPRLLLRRPFARACLRLRCDADMRTKVLPLGR